MPTVRKLAPEEVQTVENKGKGVRKITEEQYDRLLAEYEVGDYGEAMPAAGEKRLTVRNRFRAAGVRRGVGLQFLHTRGEAIRFKVVSGNGNGAGEVEPAPAPEPEPAPVASDAPPKRKAGRPKKVRS